MCAERVRPVDTAPVRSPQAVHSVIAYRVMGKSLVEIGTRNGDGMECFAQFASNATAVEMSRPYCNFLLNRSAALQRSTGASFGVTCKDYRLANGLDADIFTWWQEPPELSSVTILQQLHRLHQAGNTL